MEKTLDSDRKRWHFEKQDKFHILSCLGLYLLLQSSTQNMLPPLFTKLTTESLIQPSIQATPLGENWLRHPFSGYSQHESRPKGFQLLTSLPFLSYFSFLTICLQLINKIIRMSPDTAFPNTRQTEEMQRYLLKL